MLHYITTSTNSTHLCVPSSHVLLDYLSHFLTGSLMLLVYALFLVAWLLTCESWKASLGQV